MIRALSRFARSRFGGSAVELALVAPVLVAVGVLAVEGWEGNAGAGRMRAGLDAASRYAMAGGTDQTAMRTLALEAWTGRPANANVVVARECLCGTTVATCGTLCATTNRPPSIYYRFTASGTGEGVFGERRLQSTQVVRVR